MHEYPRRHCDHCGAEYTPHTTWQRFDSGKCRDDWRSVRLSEERRERRERRTRASA